MGYIRYPEYINSRLDSDIQIPVNWEERRLKFIASHNDESLVEATSDDFEMLYVDISSVDLINGIKRLESTTFEKSPSRARRIARNGDTVISTVRTYLKAIAPIKDAPENLVVSTGFAVVRPRKDVDADYLSYFLQNQGFVGLVVANSVGVSYPAINASDLVCIPAYFPKKLLEQRKIATFLDYKTRQIDQLIEKKKALIETLEEMRIAVITRAVTKGIDKNSKLKPSDVDWAGDIPSHWEVKKLKFSIKKLASGVSVNAEQVSAENNERGVLKTSCVYGNNFRSSENKKIFNEEYGREQCPVLADSIIISRMNTPELVGHCGYVENNHDNLFLPDRLWITEFEKAFTGKVKYFWYLLTSKGVQGETSYLATGASDSMKNLTQPDYLSIKVPVPPSNEQEEILRFIDDVESSSSKTKSKVTKAISLLQEYRTAIITSAVTGKIDVQKVDIPKEIS